MRTVQMRGTPISIHDVGSLRLGQDCNDGRPNTEKASDQHRKLISPRHYAVARATTGHRDKLCRAVGHREPVVVGCGRLHRPDIARWGNGRRLGRSLMGWNLKGTSYDKAICACMDHPASAVACLRACVPRLPRRRLELIRHRTLDGACVGRLVGRIVGVVVGWPVGRVVGVRVGDAVVGIVVGALVGVCVMNGVREKRSDTV